MGQVLKTRAIIKKWGITNTFRIYTLQCFKPTLLRFLINILYFALYGCLAYKQILSISSWCFIRLSILFVFLDLEPPIIIFCMDDQEFDSRFHYFFDIFSSNVLQNYFDLSLTLGISVSWQNFMNGIFDPRGYVVIPSSSHLIVQIICLMLPKLTFSFVVGAFIQ